MEDPHRFGVLSLGRHISGFERFWVLHPRDSGFRHGTVSVRVGLRRVAAEIVRWCNMCGYRINNIRVPAARIGRCDGVRGSGVLRPYLHHDVASHRPSPVLQ